MMRLICRLPVVLLLLVTFAPSAWGVDLHVMSFNIRYSRGGLDEAATENNWTDPTYPRRERAIRVIREAMPDVLGVQEARHLQIVDLREALPEYDFYGVGRDDGKEAGEYTAIFYLKDRFKREDAGEFWLSDTPDKPGTSFYTAPNAVPRFATWVRLRDNKADQTVCVLNAHWDHISAPARRKSGALMRARLPELRDGLPAIVMGDLNAKEDSRAVVELLKPEPDGTRILHDSYRTLHPERAPNEGTFNAWHGKTDGARIDYVLYTGGLIPTAAEIVRTSYDGRWPSDHYPITATFRYAANQQSE